MAVLGLIAGLTVPNIVVSIDRSKNISTLREAFQTVSAITQAGVLNGDFASITDWDIVSSTDPKGIVAYLSSKINYSKQCLATNITDEGCRRGTSGKPASGPHNAHNARWILPNGAKIQAHCPSYFNASWMTWTVTSKAYAFDMTPTGNNPDTIYVTCNLLDAPQTVFGVPLKSGMCGMYGAVYVSGDNWGAAQFDKALGYGS